MRGTFRASVAVAVLAGAYGVYERVAAFSEAKDRNFKMMLTLECGSRLSEETLRRTLNEHGLLDLGKVGCASEPFRASFDEIRQARDGVWRRDWQETRFDMKAAAEYALGYAAVALLLVNLLGLAFVAVRAVFGWIATGYRPAP
ncbi:hypothetical protein [Bradyrhizobium jicamae]|nr:hypothetical protein [Bradyrhizobium jicamae]